MNPDDAAETGRLTEAVERILAALERFNRFSGPDPAGRNRSAWREILDRPLPERGCGLDRVLEDLAGTVIPHGLRNGAPGFSGWVTTAPTTAGAAATLAATVAGSQRWWVQPFNLLETVALRWLAELLGIPPELQGTFTSGGSSANLVGLGAARQHAFEKIGRDPSRDGLPADTRWGLYAGSEVHHVVHRAAGVLGLGRRSVTRIPVDRDQRIAVDGLRETLAADRKRGIVPVAIVATAGTVNTGAIDPIDELADLAEEFGAWLHVDGAYGLFGILDPAVAGRFRGLGRADSVVVDPHKWLAAPVGCGAVFVRGRDLLGRAFTVEPAEYLEGSEGAGAVESPFDRFGDLYHNFNLEQSSPSRGSIVWAILKEVGAVGMRRRVIRHNGFARRLAELVRADENLELLAEPVLSICCFRHRPPGMTGERLDPHNEAVARRLRADGRFIPSTTRVSGKFALRPCYINPRTTVSEVEGLARRVREIGDSLAGGGSS